MSQKARNPIKATKTSFAIVEALAESDGATVTELADSLDLSKGSVSNHLATLTELGYVTSDGAEYHVGAGFLRLGTIARDRRDIAEITTKYVDQLAEVTGEESGVAVRENDSAVYLHTTSGEFETDSDLVPGLQIPLYCTAPGKAMLAHFPDNEIEDYLERGERIEHTGTTITDPGELDEELRVIREQGLAFNRGEYRPDRNGLAAPILSDGEIYGAIGITGPASRVSGKTLQQDAAGLVVSVANQIEKEFKRQ